MTETTHAEKQKFKLENFEGPLDLLLFLIQKSEVNIYDIPIATITEQYLAYLSYATRVDLENITEFYLMAATLLYIKSRLLLPVEVDLQDEWEDPRRELADKLIEYQKFRKLSELMEEKEHAAEWVIERKRTQPILPFSEEELWEEVDVWDLLRTFSTMISVFSADRVIDLHEEVTVNEKITLIFELLETKGEFFFGDLLIKKASIMEVICGFLAVLELAKTSAIAVFQNRMFGDILIRPKQKGSQDES